MDNTINIRQQLLTEINQLPQEKLNLLLNFVNSLKIPNENNMKEEIIDPLADFIGAVEIGNITKNIEQDLYE